MFTFTTEIMAINPQTGELVKWSGPRVRSISFAHAQQYCNENGLGYCNVTGILIADIPANCSKEIKLLNFNEN